MMIGIGSTVWVFDINRRRYRQGERGSPIWREHWRPETIKEESSRRWITNFGTKIPKKDADPSCIAFSESDIERAAFIHDNAYRIGEAVGRLRDHDMLKTIAEMIDYTPR